ncbi:MAG: hypothetical protein KDA45_08555 [Planctomycetales bacterium]|nr:hypothetical protein [Planctomycetales bacterium]
MIQTRQSPQPNSPAVPAPRSSLRGLLNWPLLACVLLLQAPLSGYLQAQAVRTSKSVPLSEELVEQASNACPSAPRRCAHRRRLPFTAGQRHAPRTSTSRSPFYAVGVRNFFSGRSSHRWPNGLRAPLRC